MVLTLPNVVLAVTAVATAAVTASVTAEAKMVVMDRCIAEAHTAVAVGNKAAAGAHSAPASTAVAVVWAAAVPPASVVDWPFDWPSLPPDPDTTYHDVTLHSMGRPPSTCVHC